MPKSQCPFCDPPKNAIVVSNELSLAVNDNYPVSPGHLLFVPRRHVSSWFDATEEEQTSILRLINQVHKGLPPADYNIGINIGEAAGQTVFHLHVHLIPRVIGDVEDPRGGVRYVIPNRAKYWGE